MYDFFFAILCSNKKQCSIFDSHAKNAEGITDPNGTAGLFHFQNPAEMVKYLKYTTKGENVQIDLYPVTVQFMRTELMGKDVSCVANLSAVTENDLNSGAGSLEEDQDNRKISS